MKVNHKVYNFQKTILLYYNRFYFMFTAYLSVLNFMNIQFLFIVNKCTVD